MLHSKLNLAFGFSIGAMLVCDPATVALSNDTPVGTLTPNQIFEKVQENYASLSSYSDEGQIVETMDDTVTTTGFIIRLARTNFYRIEWDQRSESPYRTENIGPQGVWSSGAGDYVEMGWGVQRQYDREVALANAADTSGGAAATIPQIFLICIGETKMMFLCPATNSRPTRKLAV
jgi:hypothetical protein